MTKLVLAPLTDERAFALAERVVAVGRRATFTQDEQMALCLWIVAQRPAEPGEFTVTIHGAVPFDQMQPATQTALQHLIERAREAAVEVLRGDAPPAFPQASPGLRSAIEQLIAARKAAAREGLGVGQINGAVVDLYKSIDALNQFFEEEFPR